jgi:hypothetical protein
LHKRKIENIRVKQGKTGMDLKKLSEPFATEDIEWRVQRAGKTSSGVYCMVLAYVTNRAIMQRLDEVVGIGNWRNEFEKAPDGGIMCGISIRLPRLKESSGDGYVTEDDWVTKWDGAENTQVEAVKGGLSGAMKRAAVQWGIGRYLYKLDANFAKASLEKVDGWERARFKNEDNKTYTTYYWQIPTLPKWALPEVKDGQ